MLTYNEISNIVEKLSKYKNNIPLSEIKDANGNPRFIEGEGKLAEISGVTFTYNKWSLSGTHLMFVIAGEADNTAVIPTTDLVTYRLPKFIMDKIYNVWANRIERKSIEFIAVNYSAQSLTAYLGKQDGANPYIFIVPTALTLTADRFFRIQFDLLIDTE